MGIMQRFQEGGVFMYFILAFGVVTFSLIVERTLGLYVRLKTAPQGFRQKILEYVSHGDLQGAKNYAVSAGAGTSLGRIAEIGCHLRGNAGGEEEVQARMDEALTEEISRIDRKTGFLAMFGNVATLLGLLGTITGMIHSFAAVANASPADRATMLSRGISEAMNCTAFGLIVAIPALVAYALFQNRTDRLVSALTEEATQIFHDLLFLVESSPSAEAKAPSPQASRPAPSKTAYRQPEANA
jgi:biopolymer transport protein ExbB/TolQ